MYEEFAAATVEAVGGPGNIKRVTHCTTRLRFQLDDISKVDKARIAQYPEAMAVVEASGGLHVIVGMNVPDVHKAVAALPGVTTDGERTVFDASPTQGRTPVGEAGALAADDDAAQAAAPASTAKEGGRPKIIDRILGAISAIFTPYIPVLASIGIIQGFLALAVNAHWLTATSNTYVILDAAPKALIYFFPILLAFTAAKQFGANPFVGAVIGAALLEPGLAAINQNGKSLDFVGIPFVGQGFQNTVIPIIIGMFAFGYLEKGLKRVLPKVAHLLLVPLFSVVIMVPLMMLVFGPVGSFIANGIADGYKGLVAYPILLSLLFGGFFIYVIMIGAHWIVLPIQLGILASQGREYSLAAGGMGNYALLGVMLAVLIFNRDKATRTVAGGAAFVNFLSGVTEPGLYGVVIKNKRYFVAVTIGGLAGGLVCGLFGTYITSFAFTGLFGIPAFASSPTAGGYFVAVGVSIVSAFVVTAIVEKAANRRPRPDADREIGRDGTGSNDLDEAGIVGTGTPAPVREGAVVAP